MTLFFKHLLPRVFHLNRLGGKHHVQRTAAQAIPALQKPTGHIFAGRLQRLSADEPARMGRR